MLEFQRSSPEPVTSCRSPVRRRWNDAPAPATVASPPAVQMGMEA